MKKCISMLSCVVLIVGAFVHAAHSQPKPAVAPSLPDQAEAADKSFYKAIDKQSIRSVKAAIAEYEKLLVSAKGQSNRRVEATALTRIGEATALIGQMPRSLEHLRIAVEIWESLGAPLEAANVLTTIGNVQYVIEDYQNALRSLERASALRKPLDPVGELHTMVALGGAYKALGYPEKSIESYEKALALVSSTDDKYAAGFVLERVSIIRPTERFEYLNQAVQAYREAENKSGVRSGSVTNRILTATGNAIDSSTQAERVKYMHFMNDAEKQTFLNTPRSAGVVPLSSDTGDRGRGPYSLAKVGLHYFSNRDRTNAIKCYIEALNWSRRDDAWHSEYLILGYLTGYYAAPKDEERFAYYFNLMSLASLHNGSRSAFERDSNLRGARGTLEYGLISIEKARNKPVSEEIRASFAVEVQRHFERFINLLMEMHEFEPGGGHSRLALKTAELAKSRALLDSLVVAEVNLRTGISHELVKREQGIRAKLNSLAELEIRSSSLSQSVEPSQTVRDQISALTTEYAEVHGKIRQEKLKGLAIPPPAPERFARIRSEFRLTFKEDNPIEPLPITVFDIQSELSETDTVLLEYFLGDEKSFLWKVTGTAIDSYELPARPEIESIARETYREIKDLASRPSSLKSRDYSYSQDLSDMTLGPVAEQIKGKRLVIVADGALQYIPFSALPQPTAASIGRGPKSRVEDKEFVPLAVTNEIVSLPSASVLSVLRKESASRTAKGEGIAVVADPVFSESDERLARNGGSPTPGENKADHSRMALERAFRFKTAENEPFAIPRLPFTRREAESIFAAAPKSTSIKALDFEADREKLLKTDLSKYRIIHFATHGILHSEHPDLSGIVLSLVNEKGEPVNGFLRLNEIYNMNLNADLVVLSACQTALGKEVRGEGLIGLTRGFMYAGSPRVVASLWKVDDVATAELMKIFYQKMLKEKMRPAAALRAAKIAMYKTKRWNAPYYWAAFELQGEWR